VRAGYSKNFIKPCDQDQQRRVVCALAAAVLLFYFLSRFCIYSSSLMMYVCCVSCLVEGALEYTKEKGTGAKRSASGRLDNLLANFVLFSEVFFFFSFLFTELL
jgi:hypothetical protein